MWLIFPHLHADVLFPFFPAFFRESCRNEGGLPTRVLNSFPASPSCHCWVRQGCAFQADCIRYLALHMRLPDHPNVISMSSFLDFLDFKQSTLHDVGRDASDITQGADGGQGRLCLWVQLARGQHVSRVRQRHGLERVQERRVRWRPWRRTSWPPFTSSSCCTSACTWPPSRWACLPLLPSALAPATSHLSAPASCLACICSCPIV